VADRFTVKHWDDFERTGRRSLVRRSLGVSAFAPAGTFARLAPEPIGRW
jgi:hypothetical protein